MANVSMIMMKFMQAMYPWQKSNEFTMKCFTAITLMIMFKVDASGKTGACFFRGIDLLYSRKKGGKKNDKIYFCYKTFVILDSVDYQSFLCCCDL